MLTKFENIPNELKQLKQWLVWRYEETGPDSKPTKVPYMATAQRHASVTDSATWSTFDEAINALKWCGGSLHGLGFVFTKDDPYTGIDLDATEDAKSLERQQKIFKEFNSYSELSPSGKGLHIIIKANLLSGRRRSAIELYSSDRFFTMTGDVFHDAPIEDRQELATILWEEMGKVKNVGGFQGTLEERDEDAEILDQALNAVNGDRFKKLLEGNWADVYSSQSEADFAFIDMIAFYTQSRNQITRIFRNSALGQRAKAKRSDYVEYMLNKAFDRMLPPVDIDGLQNALTEAIERKKLEDEQRAQAIIAGSSKGRTAAFEAVNVGSIPTPAASPYTLPPGLLGEIAAFIYEAAPRPVPEIALAGAIAFVSGICGRAYNVSGTGLNHYVLLLAQTAIGKEAMARGMDKLINAIHDEIPAVEQFIGPAGIASGQALLKYLPKSPCFLSTIGEFGYKIEQLYSPRASQAEVTFKAVLLDLYNKSGNEQSVKPSIYSQKENNTEKVLAPAVSLLGEATPETFFSVIDERIISDGLLPRFNLIEYTGKRPPRNEQHGSVKPSDNLCERLKALVDYCLKLNSGVSSRPICVNVAFTDEAKKFSDDFDLFADDKINNSQSGVYRELWSRSHVKLMKLAALVAVGCNPYNPQITLDHVKWADKLIKHDIEKLMSRFESGRFGKQNNESDQERDIRRKMREFVEKPFATVGKYAHNCEKMHYEKVIPYSYINKRLVSVSCFKTDKIGATNAIKKTLETLKDSGFIKEIGKNELNSRFGTSQRAFVIANMEWLFAP